MLCERCKDNKANIYITKIVNGKKQVYTLCEKCAKEIDGGNLVNDFNINPLAIENLFGGLIDYMGYNQCAGSNLKRNKVCNNCGMSFEEFKNIGLVGCSHCYDVFKENLTPVIKRVQMKANHIGKIPSKKTNEISIKKKINNLKEELQKAISLEEYERAAELRDEIRELQERS